MATDLTKIATCCYCGTRSVLRLDRVKHALTCRACGAALQNMKPIKMSKRREDPVHKRQKSDRYARPFGNSPKSEKPKKKRSKRHKHRFELDDLFEDVFDALFDILD